VNLGPQQYEAEALTTRLRRYIETKLILIELIPNWKIPHTPEEELIAKE
jgi:hypothetical protein